MDARPANDETWRAGARLAETLVGLRSDEAAAKARDDGFVPQIVPPSAAGITADLRRNRICLIADETGVIVRAHAG